MPPLDSSYKEISNKSSETPKERESATIKEKQYISKQINYEIFICRDTIVTKE